MNCVYLLEADASFKLQYNVQEPDWETAARISKRSRYAKHKHRASYPNPKTYPSVLLGISMLCASLTDSKNKNKNNNKTNTYKCTKG